MNAKIINNFCTQIQTDFLIYIIRLEFDYVVVVLGASKPYLKVHGAYEQIIRVNCISYLESGNGALLHLERKAHYNRECLPTFIPEM